MAWLKDRASGRASEAEIEAARLLSRAERGSGFMKWAIRGPNAMLDWAVAGTRSEAWGRFVYVRGESRGHWYRRGYTAVRVLVIEDLM